jgi:hypothetical protein
MLQEVLQESKNKERQRQQNNVKSAYQIWAEPKQRQEESQKKKEKV